MKMTDAFFADLCRIARRHGIAEVGTSILPFGRCEDLEVIVFSEVQGNDTSPESVWQQQNDLEAVGGKRERWGASTSDPKFSESDA